MTKTVWLGLFTMIITFSFLTIGKVISLQIKSGNILQGTQNNVITEKKDHYTERGAIFDRNDNILAMQIKRWNVGLRLIDTTYPQKVIKQLSQILNIPQATLKTKLKNPVKYVHIKRLISKKEHDEIHALQKQGKLKGVQLHALSWREYPGKDSIAHVIGYYGSNKKGLAGIEYTYDSYLKPEKNAIGASLYLTIDSILQKSIEEIVKKTQEEAQAAYINTILMDAKTGEILSFVSIPSFNSNKYYTYSQENLANKIIQYNYEPGSVFKVFTIASLLDSGVITPNSIFNAGSPFISARYGFTITDIWYPGIINTSQILKYSSNVGISHAVSRMNNIRFFQYLKNFGFGDETDISLPGEHSGILYPPNRWSARSKHTIGLGQEIAVTAMQIVTAATAIANDGVMLKPQLVKKIVSYQGKSLYNITSTPRRKVLRAETANTILRMMKTSTEPGGTAHRMRLDGVSISAKTGTAQVFDVQQKQYSEESFIASALAIVPTENPRLIIYTAIHKPTSGETYGGRTAAPMLKKMLTFILPYMGIAGNVAQFKYASTRPSFNRINPVQTYKSTVYENYVGLSKREIWTMFAKSTIKLVLKGNGHVVSQIPPSGTSIKENRTLTLYFQ